MGLVEWVALGSYYDLRWGGQEGSKGGQSPGVAGGIRGCHPPGEEVRAVRGTPAIAT